ncbi:MAG: hypothetical protein JJU11_09445 [Candidatus Sumerlaeia bacterium]|nr:hypothetical protein [Candidatus Sumerlaeia bacterium]
MQQRPASVIVLAAIGGFLGVIGLLVCGLNLVGSLMVIAGDENAINQMAETGLELGSSDIAILAVTEFVALVLSVLLMAGSVGIFLLKSWGRLCMLTYAALTLPNNFCMTFFYMKAALPPALEQSAAGPDVPMGGVLAIAIICLSCGWLIANLYPIAVLVFLNLKTVKYAFETGGTPPPDQWGGGGGGFGHPHPEQYAQPQPYPQGYYPPPNQPQQDQPAPQPPEYPYYPPGDQGGYQPPAPPEDQQRRE